MNIASSIAAMATKTFVNMPVKDLQKTILFFTKLGFKFNPEFTDRNATCMTLGKDSYAMLLVEKFFRTFTKKPICDTKKNNEMILSISVGSRKDVDKMMNKALKAGGKAAGETIDLGWMYNRCFQDLDGHRWEAFYMNNAARKKAMKKGI